VTVAVVGAGAAGLVAAAFAAAGGADVTLIERTADGGRKILISGGGRCNVLPSVLAPERFLPSTFLGLVLGWVRYRTNSVLPCMLLHTMHNGFVLTVVYWRDELAANGFGMEEAAHLPATWLAMAAVGVAIAISLLVVSSRISRSPAS
jgi:membrane protease YdiL (CAAX protease family)